MPDNVLICGVSGIGDTLLSFQCASMVEKQGFQPTVILATREDVFNPVNYLFGADFNIVKGREDWTKDYCILNDPLLIAKLRVEYNCKDFYYVEPDLLYRNPYSFDYKRFFCHPQTIRQQRLLTHRWKPHEIVYVGLVTSTDNYLYGAIPELLIELGKALPNHEIYFPKVKKWAGRELNLGNFSRQFPSNVTIHEDPKLEDSLDILMKSEYGIYTDNGPSHISYQLGQQRLLLDPRFGFTRQTGPWVARWRSSIEDSVSINCRPEDVTRLVVTNLQVPQTQLLPKAYVISNLNSEWSRELIFKF